MLLMFLALVVVVCLLIRRDPKRQPNDPKRAARKQQGRMWMIAALALVAGLTLGHAPVVGPPVSGGVTSVAGFLTRTTPTGDQQPQPTPKPKPKPKTEPPRPANFRSGGAPMPRRPADLAQEPAMPAAHSPDTVPDHLLADSAWRAALHLLTADLFAHDGRVWAHVYLDPGFIDFAAILAESWSSGERRLPGLVDLTELTGGLDDSNWRLLVGALALRHAGICGSAWPLDLAGLLEG